MSLAQLISVDNEVFSSYAFWAAVLIVKMLAMSILTSIARFRTNVSSVLWLYTLYFKWFACINTAIIYSVYTLYISESGALLTTTWPMIWTLGGNWSQMWALMCVYALAPSLYAHGSIIIYNVD